MTAPALSRISLGSLPAGKHAVDFCVAFKRAVQQRFGRIDGAFLLTVENSEEGKRGVEVMYDPSEPEAVAWAEDVRDAAREVWEQVTRSAERVR